VVLSAAALVAVAVTGVYICKCEHPKSEHKRGQHGCRTPDCGCGQFEADLRASAAAQGVQLTTGSPVSAPEGRKLGDPTTAEWRAAAGLPPLDDGVPFAAAGAVPTSELDLGSTSAQLQRAQDDLAAALQQRDRALYDLDKAKSAFALASSSRERNRVRAMNAEAELVKVAEAAGRDIADPPDVDLVARVAELRRGRTEATERALQLAAELERLRALIARVEQAAGIVQWEDLNVDLADRVQSIREGRTEAIDVLCDIAQQRDVLAQHQRWLCEACGARYGKPYTDHPCGQLTPITVTTTRGATSA
jgi:hypothetical protein